MISMDGLELFFDDPMLARAAATAAVTSFTAAWHDDHVAHRLDGHRLDGRHDGHVLQFYNEMQKCTGEVEFYNFTAICLHEINNFAATCALCVSTEFSQPS